MFQPKDIPHRVAIGLPEPVEVWVSGLAEAIPVQLSEHAKRRWCERVFHRCTETEALSRLVFALEGGEQVSIREQKPSWLRSRRKNSFYLLVGSTIVFPAEPVRGSSRVIEVLTCATNWKRPASQICVAGFREPGVTKRGSRLALPETKARDRRWTQDRWRWELAW